ncbi:MAG: hypothetical protein R3213_12020 [Flavobacteriaceae bacterium]|nr:hypothetical protein [Flavobacteriaceae bacterium]
MATKILFITVMSTLLSSILFFAYVSKAEDATPTVFEATIEKVVSSPYEYEGKKIQLEGEVSRLKFTKSFTGKPYTLFELVDPLKNMINVYAEGHLEIEKGEKLRIHGKFSTEKNYFLFKFKNVVKAKTFEILG